MPRGLPDYYNPDTLVSQRLANVEEIVTHQRGIASLDNRGRTLYYTNFGDGVYDWLCSKSNDGVVPVASIDYAEIAPCSLKMDAGTDTGGGWSNVHKDFRLFDIGKAGFEFSFGYYAETARILAQFYYNDGITSHTALITVDYDARKMYVYDDGVKTALFDLPGDPDYLSWTPVKIVMNFETNMYERIIIGQEQFDLSSYVMQSGLASLKGYLSAQFTADAQDDGTNIAYIGHVAVTVDEP